MFTEPEVKKVRQQAYVAIRSTVTMGKLGSIIEPQLDEVLAQLKRFNAEPSGPPLIRYHVCPTIHGNDASLEVSIGWPIEDYISFNDVVTSDILPDGNYVSLVYTGVDNGINGNAKLISWARENGYIFDSWELPNSEGFESRVEYMMDGPDDDPDMSTWRTEVLIKLK